MAVTNPIRDKALARMADGESPSAVAKSLGVSPGTVRSWKSRAASSGARSSTTPTGGVDGGASPPARPNLRPCRSRDCGALFVPTNANHWYHEPACRDAESKWRAEEVLALEAGVDPFEHRGELELAKAAFAQKNVVLRALASKTAMRDYLRHEIRTLYEEHPEYRLPPVAPPLVTRGRKDAREIIIIASDWQIGKLEQGIGVDAMRDERLPRLMDAARSITMHFRDSGYVVNRAHVVFAGDMIEGCYIYGGQNVSGLDRTGNTHRITMQIGLAAHLEAALVRDIASYVPEVIVHSVPGNHGRPNGKNDFADPEDNFDTMVAYWAQDKSALVANAKWDIEPDWKSIFAVAGHVVVAFHGDQWRGPVWQLERLLPQYITSGEFGETIPTLAICGHRHDFASFRVNRTTVIQNGTIDGGSRWYLKAYGRKSTPVQTIVIMSQRYGVESIYPVYF